MADELTIDELARETGMTVRNIRAHQSRGLLPPPEVRARTGYYGPEHVDRLRLITNMQAEGFNLAAIHRIIEASDGTGAQILDFGREVLGAFDEEPELTTADELARRFGGTLDVKALQKAEKLGLVRPLGDDRFELVSPTLMRAGEELVALGIPLSHALAVAERIQRNSRPIADLHPHLRALGSLRRPNPSPCVMLFRARSVVPHWLAASHRPLHPCLKHRAKLPQRRNPMTRLSFVGAVLAAVLLPSASAAANSYPDRPIRAIASQGPGGLSDVFMRALADEIGPELGETVVVENRVGAAGSIGARACADAPPDGYTICILNGESMLINPLIFKNMSLDPKTTWSTSPGCFICSMCLR